MSAESTGLSARFRHGRLAFRQWRWQRPFWAGVLTLVSGVPIAYFPYEDLTLGQLTVRMSTTTGSASLIIGVLLFVLGLTMWFQPVVRVFAGVATIMLGLVSLVESNVGGFLLGFVPALLGGALAISWAPGVPVTDEPGEKAELPDSDPGPAGEDTPDTTRPDEPFLPAQSQGDDQGRTQAPVLAGGRVDEETTKENGRHRAG